VQALANLVAIESTGARSSDHDDIQPLAKLAPLGAKPLPHDPLEAIAPYSRPHLPAGRNSQPSNSMLPVRAGPRRGYEHHEVSDGHAGTLSRNALEIAGAPQAVGPTECPGRP